MTNYLQFEAKKHRYVQAAGGMTVTFIIHPNDPVPPELAAAALGTVFMVRLQQTDSGSWIDEQASMPDVDSRPAAGAESSLVLPTAAQQSGEETAAPLRAGSLAQAEMSEATGQGKPSGTAGSGPPNSKPKRSFAERSLAEQAGIRCNDASFANFLKRRAGVPSGMKIDTVNAVRVICRVESRTEFDANFAAGERWRALESEYQTWLTTQQHSATYR